MFLFLFASDSGECDVTRYLKFQSDFPATMGCNLKLKAKKYYTSKLFYEGILSQK